MIIGKDLRLVIWDHLLVKIIGIFLLLEALIVDGSSITTPTIMDFRIIVEQAIVTSLISNYLEEFLIQQPPSQLQSPADWHNKVILSLGESEKSTFYQSQLLIIQDISLIYVQPLHIPCHPPQFRLAIAPKVHIYITQERIILALPVIIHAVHALNMALNIAMNVRVDITGMESNVLLSLAAMTHV